MANDCYALPYTAIAIAGLAVLGGDCRDRGVASCLSQISLFSPGWRNERRVQVAGIEASWTINGVGTLSCLLPADSAPRDRDLKGMGVLWEHPTAGVWKGTIEDLPDDFSGATWEIGCASDAQQLAWRRGPRIERPSRMQAGGLARLAIRTAQQPARLWIDRYIMEGVGPEYLIEWRGDTVLNIFNQLVQVSGQEWRVTTDSERVTTLEWRKKVGSDLRASVLIADGYHIGGGRREDSIATVANDILAVAGAEQWQRRRTVVVEDRASIRAVGRRQGPVTPFPGLVTAASLHSAGQEVLATLAEPAQPTTVVLDADNALGFANIPLRVREGDTVKLLRAGQRTPLDFRITTRTLSVTAGTMTLTGVATEEATEWEAA